jgi:hypothetical protein
MAKKIKKNGKLPEGQIQVKVRADPKPDTPFYYVNFIAVNHSPYDFCISAIKLPSQLSEEQKQIAKKGDQIPLEPVLQLIIPTTLMKGLINALSEQCNKYESQYGNIIPGATTHGKK